jgi:hypothetical protein
VIVERPALERRVLASIEAGRIPVVLGACGTGRTSLLLRLENTIGQDRSQYLDVAAAATTPERCLKAVLTACRIHPPAAAEFSAATPRAAFDSLLTFFASNAPDGRPLTFLLDEFLDVRTFESFPGLRHVQRELVNGLAESPASFVLTSRFTARVHRLLRDAPARFEVVHMPLVDTDDVQSMARLFEDGRPDWAADVAPALAALGAGRATAITHLLSTLASMHGRPDPLAALTALFSPAGALTTRYRESYEFRLHRARGYGALKAILGVLAETEALNLTEISQHLHRTPGSTKDYLSWLEDVDLVTSRGKRYSYEDPLLRVYVRLYGRPVPPTDDDIVREVGAYARARLPHLKAASAPIAQPVLEPVADSGRSGIIEID